MRSVTASVLALVMVMAVSGIGWGETATQATSSTAALVNLEMQNTTVVEGIRTLFQGRGLPYIIEPGVKGKIVELTLKGVTFDQALKAFTDAADLTYVVEEGTYIIGPSKVAARSGQTARSTTSQQSRAAKPEAAQPEAQPEGTQLAEVPTGPAAVVSPNTQVYVTQNAPVVYGHPGGLGMIDNSGYYGPSFYQAGNLRFLYGWPPVTLGGDYPYVMNFGQAPPPPPGWVNPEMQRLLQAEWAFQPQPYFTTPY